MGNARNLAKLAVDSNGDVAASSLENAAPFSFRNRIINGDMRIDQRNAGASVSPSSNTFTVDRWICNPTQASKLTVQQNAGSVTPPSGFTNYLGVTSTSAYSVLDSDYFFIRQVIEGYNVADFDWGTANAKTVTLSFWVRSSLTGNFGVVAVWGGTSANQRIYPVLYTINQANTWEYKTIVIPGDTTMAAGGFSTGSDRGIQLRFGLGGGASVSATPTGSWQEGNSNMAVGQTSVVGTSGATWYITGVQLEVGSVATEFERRPYGMELALCKRYFETLTSVGGNSPYVNFINGGANSLTQARFVLNYSVQKRSYPSFSFTTASGFSTQTGNDSLNACTALVAEHIGVNACQITTTVSSGLTVGDCSRLISNNNNTSTISISAEL